MELINSKYHTFSETSPINLNLASDTQVYWLSGTATLSGNFSVSTTGTPVDGMMLTVHYDGSNLTASGFTVTVLGVKLHYVATSGKAATPPTPASYPYLDKKLFFVSKYKAATAAWETRMYIDTTTVKWVGPGDLGDNFIGDTTLEIDSSTGVRVKALGITNAHINASAAIAYSKLSLTGSIVNADIGAAAAIAYSKLNLATSILNADVNAAAAIAYSKLNLTGSILNADINAAAAIAYSKLNLATSILNADINAAAAITYSKLNLATSILNADINGSAAIAWSKMAALTASRVPQLSAAGVIEASTVTATELGYLSGVTSAIQTQLTGKTGGGGLYTKSSAATIVLTSASNTYQILDCTSNAISITLPDASTMAIGSPFTILRKFTAGSYNITVSAHAGQTIDAHSAGPAGSYVMSGSTGQTITYLSNGTDQWVIAKA